jgi:Flp pilus assembly protein TadB
MVFGISLIVAGVLIAIYPPLLSLIVASFFIIGGTFLVFLSYSYKKLARSSDDPAMKFFIRY